jgi:mevalonate kinase
MIAGEHAVLYGGLGICQPIKERINIDLKETNNACITFTSHTFNTTLIWEKNDIEHITSHQFLFAKYILNFFLPSITHLFQKNRGLSIEVSSQIDPTKGFGSSAAFCVALVKALCIWNQNDCFDIPLLCMKVIHGVQGSGSGGDVLASFYESLVSYYTLSSPQNRHYVRVFNDYYLDLDVIYSGSKMKTADVIKHVKRHFSNKTIQFKRYIHAINKISLAIEDAINKKDPITLGNLFNQHYVLQKALHVSNDNLDMLVHRLKEKCMGAKISGSGLGDCAIGLKGIVTSL